eukprot:TRINITY_DN34552_c0_g1_i1.p1 TRINITY_DN34552_c0_g1~~TRINITY_DN34552_c0_g1_i1.p1  ORF type:complete len:1456 (-),score=225.31 TRINITY_DN34552_c0_g1_i1:179-4546(-)
MRKGLVDRFALAKHRLNGEPQWCGKNLQQQSLVNDWLRYFQNLADVVNDLASPNRGLFDDAPKVVRIEAVRAHCAVSRRAPGAAAELCCALAALNAHLEGNHPFLLGVLGDSDPTLADLAGLCTLLSAYSCALPARLRARFPETLSWLERCLASPELRAQVDLAPEDVEFCAWSCDDEADFIKRVDDAAAKSIMACERSGSTLSDLPRSTLPAPPISERMPSETRGTTAKESSHPSRASGVSRLGTATGGGGVHTWRQDGNSRTNVQQKKSAPNSESFDPTSTLVRPSMRVHLGPKGPRYPRRWRHDDVVLVPEFLCAEDDLSTYHKLLQEIGEMQTQGVKNSDWTAWHEGCHAITKNPGDSATFRSIVDRICTYFELDPRSASTRFNLYRDSADWKPLHHDSAAFNAKRALTQNVTVGISFGRERELAFMHAEHKTLTYFPMPNGTIFAFGRDVNIRWKHGINALPVNEQDNKGRISIIVWGHKKVGVEEEEQSPPLLNQDREPVSQGLGGWSNWQEKTSVHEEVPVALSAPGVSRQKETSQEEVVGASAEGSLLSSLAPALGAVNVGAASSNCSTSTSTTANIASCDSSESSSSVGSGGSSSISLGFSRLGSIVGSAAHSLSALLIGPSTSGGTFNEFVPLEGLLACSDEDSSSVQLDGTPPSEAPLSTRQFLCHDARVATALDFTDSRSTSAAAEANQGGTSDQLEMKASDGAPFRSPPPRPVAAVPTTEGLPGGFSSREEYMHRHVLYRLRGLVEQLSLSNAELAELGRTHFGEQDVVLKQIEERRRLPEAAATGVERVAGDYQAVGRSSGRGGGRGRGRGRRGRGRAEPGDAEDQESRSFRRQNPTSSIWADAAMAEEPKFWWLGNRECLCFDLPMTAEGDLTVGAPAVQQWWDVEKLGESAHFVAVQKPAGMFVVTDERGLWEASPTNFIHVAHQRIDMPSHNEPRQRGLCHRLDSHTSGVQIFGKSWDAFHHFMIQNMRHRVQKEYIALVEGRLGGGGPPCQDDPGFGVIDVPLKKWQDFHRREFGSVVCSSAGSAGVTQYRALRQWRVPARGATAFWGRERWFTLVQLRIMTGRTHQIRVHMAFIGHPLVGDTKYSSDLFEEDSVIAPRIFLHCLRMEFDEMDGSVFVAVSELAPDLQAALCRLQKLSAEGNTEAPVSLPGNATFSGFPGLASILQSSSFASLAYTNTYGDEEKPCGPPHLIKFCCRCCGSLEVAQRLKVRRGDTHAMVWSLEGTTTSASATPTQTCLGQPVEEVNGSDVVAPRADRCHGWGPGMLWVPTELQDVATSQGTVASLGAWSAAADGGVEWAWAHGGHRVNGWIRVLDDGVLDTKWGRGRWALLDIDKAVAPLLVATFNDVEHSLRLGSEADEKIEDEEKRPRLHQDGANSSTTVGAFFVVVAVRRLAMGDRSVFDEIDDRSYLWEAREASRCKTRGWPDAGVAARFRRE